MKKIVFNGLLFSQRQTGVHRYTREVLKELDKIVNPNQYELVVPNYTKNVMKFKNIKVVYYGNVKGTLWEQTSFVRYLRKNNAESVNFNNTLPLLKPGAIVIHDVCYKIHPEYFTTFRGKLTVLWHKINFRVASICKVPIVTVSHFSKYQIIDTYKIDSKRIKVIGCAWQHMNEIESDESILQKYKLQKKSFFFTLGSISINKNTTWVYKVAEKYPQYKFVIGGAKSNNADININLKNNNIMFLGYISNEEIKALMQNCKAFMFPSIYEGFGLPPLEALSQGADVITSNSASLPEIYKNSVHYIDPYDTRVDLDEILKEKLDLSESVLNRYSWKKSANNLKEFIENTYK